MVDVPIKLFPEQLITSEEVWEAFNTIQNKLSQLDSLFKTEFWNQQNAIQTAHTQVMQGLELQNLQLENQHLFNMINVGLLCVVFLLVIVLVILTAVQNRKIRKMREMIAQLDEVNRKYAIYQENQEKKLGEIWKTLCTINEKTVTLSGVVHEAGSRLQKQQAPVLTASSSLQPSKPEKLPLQDALSQMLIRAAANQCEGWGAQVKAYLANEYHLNVSYYRRRDPSGNLYQGVVEQVDDNKAPFFGVATDGRLFLLPNKRFLNALSICAGEFFIGYETAGNGISRISCAVMNKDGDFWRLANLGRINQ